jgi:hypothetical protein
MKWIRLAEEAGGIYEKTGMDGWTRRRPTGYVAAMTQKGVTVQCWALLLLAGIVAARVGELHAQPSGRSAPQLHHVGLNSVDPERAIEWYLKVWPSAKRTTVAGFPAVAADMLLLFTKVDRPLPGAWRDDLHRSEPQSAFWHIGANTNTTDMAPRLAAVGVNHLPLFTSPQDTLGVWRSSRPLASPTFRCLRRRRTRAACGAQASHRTPER